MTIEENNLLWLRGQAASAKRRSLSDALDDLVTAARTGGLPGDVRSVVGTVDIAATDPDLDLADDALRGLVQGSLSRPFLVKETPPSYGSKRTKRRG